MVFFFMARLLCRRGFWALAMEGAILFFIFLARGNRVDFDFGGFFLGGFLYGKAEVEVRMSLRASERLMRLRFPVWMYRAVVVYRLPAPLHRLLERL